MQVSDHHNADSERERCTINRKTRQNPTLRDVAKAAGVHVATASRALNPETRRLVNVGTIRRVLKVAESLGYRPNPIARSLKTAESHTVGVVLPDFTNPMFPPIVRGIDDVLGPAGYHGLIVNTDNDLDREAALISSLLSRHVDGLIIATALLDHPLLRRLHEQNVRMVLVNRRTDDLDVPCVMPDDAAGVMLAVRHLAALGHTRIVHLAGPQTTSAGVARANAFRAAVREHGLAGDPELVAACDHWSEEDGARTLRQVLDAGVEFTAILAGNDLIALGCYDVIAERGIDCPAQVSVVGFNDMPFLDKLRPPLSSVAVPQHELGAEAARMLLERFTETDRPARSVLLPLSLVVRGSTAEPAVSSRSRRQRRPRQTTRS
jgi:LacI family transcriptional regulator